MLGVLSYIVTFLKKIKNFWCCHKNIVVLWQNKEEWQRIALITR